MLHRKLALRAVVSDLVTPVSMAFLGADDILVNEKNTGQVKRIVNGVVQAPCWIWLSTSLPNAGSLESSFILIAQRGLPKLQQLRWGPERIADKPKHARARLFVLPGSKYIDQLEARACSGSNRLPEQSGDRKSVV